MECLFLKLVFLLLRISQNYLDEDCSCFNLMVLTICIVLAIGFSFNFSAAFGLADFASL
jgi:hypothetical protein